jgi:hypothetical protein
MGASPLAATIARTSKILSTLWHESRPDDALNVDAQAVAAG